MSLADVISGLFVRPLEILTLGMEPCHSATSAIEARLVSPSSSDFVVVSLPPCVYADRPLELELAVVGLCAGAGAAMSVASWISAHACLQIAVDVPGQPRGEVYLPVSARPSGVGWIVRALAHPSAWADATYVTVVSLSLAGRPLPCDCLPATLRVGYNHAPAPAGAVLTAAKFVDVKKLQGALDAGGSTEEADEVRDARQGRPKREKWGRKERIRNNAPLRPFWLQHGFTASYWAAARGHLEALRTLLAAGANPAATTRVRGEEDGRTKLWRGRLGPFQGGRGKASEARYPPLGRPLGCLRAA